jgi:hypothetical protein
MRNANSTKLRHRVVHNANHDRVRTWCDNASDGMAKVGPTRGIPVSVCGVQYDPLHYYSIIRVKQLPTNDHQDGAIRPCHPAVDRPLPALDYSSCLDPAVIDGALFRDSDRA